MEIALGYTDGEWRAVNVVSLRSSARTKHASALRKLFITRVEICETAEMSGMSEESIEAELRLRLPKSSSTTIIDDYDNDAYAAAILAQYGIHPEDSAGIGSAAKLESLDMPEKVKVWLRPKLGQMNWITQTLKD